ncbi:HPr family phosphocarrier protein, partial [Rathayibacter tanaceti]|uniref:HPr family phosphocarrier protein n=1 Tax=Rathayibacter tanaceti TaxID=1671680 RepID=UPI000AE9083D
RPSRRRPPPSSDPAADRAQRRVLLINPNGLHARPAADFVTLATTFDARIDANGKDATSLLGVMSLGLDRGDEVVLTATGPQAEEAVGRLAALVESGFGEV